MSFTNPYRMLLGVEEIEATDGKAVLELPLKKELTQLRGTAHGGALASLIDMAVGSALHSKLADNESFTTVELSINYLRPGTGAKLIAKGNVVKFGKTICVGEAKIYNDEETLVAIGNATCMIIRK